MRDVLSKRQRQILLLMRQHGNALFAGLTRKFSWSMTEHGLCIRCYQYPQHFLKARGLIEVVSTNHPGTWYRLTDDGRRRAARLQGAP